MSVSTISAGSMNAPLSSNRRKKRVVHTPKTNPPILLKKKRSHKKNKKSGRKEKRRKKNSHEEEDEELEDEQEEINIPSNSVAAEDEDEGCLSTSSTNMRIQWHSLFAFNFTSIAPGTKTQVKLTHVVNSQHGIPMKQTITLYIVTGMQNGPIGLYNSSCDAVSETASLKVFHALDCKTMSGQYVILSEEIPTRLLQLFSEKIVTQIDYFVEFRGCYRGKAICIPPCVVTSVDEYVLGNTQALGLELLSSFGIELVLYSNSMVKKEQEEPNNYCIISSPSDFTREKSVNLSIPSRQTLNESNKINCCKTLLTSKLAVQVDKFVIPRYTICQDFTSHAGLHYTYFKNVEQMIWRSLLAGSVVLNTPPGMEEEQINSIVHSCYEPFSQNLSIENDFQLQEHSGDNYEDANKASSSKLFENHLYSNNLSDKGVVELFVQPGEKVSKSQLVALVHSSKGGKQTTTRIVSQFGGIITAVLVEPSVNYGDFIACVSKEKNSVDKMLMKQGVADNSNISSSDEISKDSINNVDSINQSKLNDNNGFGESYESDASEEF
jgi:hypothetical protein